MRCLISAPEKGILSLVHTSDFCRQRRRFLSPEKAIFVAREGDFCRQLLNTEYRKSAGKTFQSPTTKISVAGDSNRYFALGFIGR